MLVVNASSPHDSISRQDAALIFLSKKRSWPGGGNIAVVINENPQIYRAFSYSVLKKSPRQYLIFRKKMLFRGQGMPPPTVASDQEVVDFLAAHHNGIGFIAPDNVTPAVKVLHLIP